MSLTSATVAEFDAFLLKYGWTVDEDKEVLLALSFAFLKTLSFCVAVDDAVIVEAQCFIAYSMSSGGGGFDPSALASDKILTEEHLGRGAIIEKYEINDLLSGTTPLNMLRTMPLAYGTLRPYLCGDSAAVAFVV